jgi:hypothetical protein
MTYDYSAELQQLIAAQLEDLTISYADETVGLGLWDEGYGQDDLETEVDYPAGVTGMRALDYEPALDSYEYQQSLYS